MREGLFGIFSYIVLIIFFLFSFGNLYMNYKEKETEKAFFKVFLMPFLALFYFLHFKNLSNFILIALLFSWMGDVILIRSNVKNVVLGIIFFSIAHIMYIIQMGIMIEIRNLNYILTIFILIFYLGMGYFVNSFIREYAYKTLKKRTNIIYYYGGLLCLLCSFSILLATNSINGALYLIFGSNLFLLSDTILSYSLFVRQNKLINSSIMATYLLGQIFIVFGFGIAMI